MSRWIDADALIDRLDYCVKEGIGSTIAFTFKHMVDDAPSINIEPKRGEWKRRIVDNGFNADWVCSECGYRVKTDFVDYNFCPNCGAKMTDKDINVPNKLPMSAKHEAE